MLRMHGFSGCSLVKNPPFNAGDLSLIPGWEDLLEKEMATHSSTLAWENPMAEEPGGVIGHRVAESQTWLGD